MKRIAILIIILIIVNVLRSSAQGVGNSVHMTSKKVTPSKSKKAKLDQYNAAEFKKHVKSFVETKGSPPLTKEILDTMYSNANHSMKYYRKHNESEQKLMLNNEVQSIMTEKKFDVGGSVDQIVTTYKADKDSTDKNNSSDTACCRVKIFGTGGANPSVTNLAQGTGNLSIGAMVKLGKGDKSWSELYTMFNAHAANSSDSASMQKAFLFPEIGKRLFVVGYSYVSQIPNTCLSIIPYADISYNKVTDSSMTFNTISPTIGCRFEIHNDNVKFGDSTVPFVLSFVPYYSLISVDPKYFSATNNVYDKTFNNQPLPPTFHSLGLEVSFQLSSFQIFANAKYVLNTKNTSINSIGTNNIDLQGLVFVIGATLSTDILNFDFK